MRRTRSRAAARQLPTVQAATVWQCASVLLGYPDATQRQHLPVVAAAAAGLPARLGEPLAAVCSSLAGGALQDLQAEYVETFDSRRRCNLYLTYFSYGDTRKRGMALLRFKQTYRAAGFALPDTGDDAELPDHLCVVLEFAATVDPTGGRTLLLEHRAGLELLRMALRDSDSRWAPVLQAVSATLPALGGDEDEAIRALAAEGPPGEEVGMDPYAMTGYLADAPPGAPWVPSAPSDSSAPSGSRAGGAIDLPMPIFQGAGR